jgi:hypothetical protein
MARPSLPGWILALGLVASATGAAGCGGSPSAPKGDEVFYLHGGGVIDKNRSWEVYYPKLDRPASTRVERLVGVAVLDGDVRFARPVDWTVRDADYTPQKRRISYQSPRQFTFSIYERVDPGEDTWTDVQRRYEEELKEQKAKIIASRMPVGAANAQGRSYVLESTVKSRPDFQGRSTEILLRSGQRVLLVQIVYPGSLEVFADEVAAAISTMVVY